MNVARTPEEGIGVDGAGLPEKTSPVGRRTTASRLPQHHFLPPLLTVISFCVADFNLAAPRRTGFPCHAPPPRRDWSCRRAT